MAVVHVCGQSDRLRSARQPGTIYQSQLSAKLWDSEVECQRQRPDWNLQHGRYCCRFVYVLSCIHDVLEILLLSRRDWQFLMYVDIKLQNFLERLVSEMTHYVSSGMLNLLSHSCMNGKLANVCVWQLVSAETAQGWFLSANKQWMMRCDWLLAKTMMEELDSDVEFGNFLWWKCFLHDN